VLPSKGQHLLTSFPVSVRKDGAITESARQPPVKLHPQWLPSTVSMIQILYYKNPKQRFVGHFDLINVHKFSSWHPFSREPELDFLRVKPTQSSLLEHHWHRSLLLSHFSYFESTSQAHYTYFGSISIITFAQWYYYPKEVPLESDIMKSRYKTFILKHFKIIYIFGFSLTAKFLVSTWRN